MSNRSKIIAAAEAFHRSIGDAQACAQAYSEYQGQILFSFWRAYDLNEQAMLSKFYASGSGEISHLKSSMAQMLDSLKSGKNLNQEIDTFIAKIQAIAPHLTSLYTEIANSDRLLESPQQFASALGVLASNFSSLASSVEQSSAHLTTAFSGMSLLTFKEPSEDLAAEKEALLLRRFESFQFREQGTTAAQTFQAVTGKLQEIEDQAHDLVKEIRNFFATEE